jgi:glycosyltransferase involved in cell wall biosynthesis
MSEGFALTICRVEPENQIEMLIESCVKSAVVREYVVIGNWGNSNYGILLKARYQNQQKIKLIDPIYDAGELLEYRSKCNFYLHGHSVGGTNPSLVEMLYFDCEIFAYDCPFNRETGENAIQYFKDCSDLVQCLDSQHKEPVSRDIVRTKYSSESIMLAYKKLLS